MTTAMLGDRIVISNDVAELRRMTTWLRACADAAEIPPELVHKLDICANEAVTNIISYAYDDGRRHEIALELVETASGVSLVIRDDGKPFNVREAPAHAKPASLDDAEIGSLGIHLMRRLMPHFDYRRENGVNVLSLNTEYKLPHANA